MGNIIQGNFNSNKDEVCIEFVNKIVDALLKSYRLKQDTLIRQGYKVNQVQHLIEVLGKFNAEILYDAYHQAAPIRSQENRDMLLNAVMEAFQISVNELDWHI